MKTVIVDGVVGEIAECERLLVQPRRRCAPPSTCGCVVGDATISSDAVSAIEATMRSWCRRMRRATGQGMAGQG